MSFFREFLTIVACLLVALLTAALAGPYFVDWNAHRAFVEDALSRATGAQVKVAGDLDVKLLPTPRIVLNDVRFAGEDPALPSVAASRMAIELAPMPLLRGQVKFSDARIDRPVVDLKIDAGGGMTLPPIPREHAAHVAFDSIAIVHARVRINGGLGAGGFTLEDISLDAAGQSLAGPWRGSGEISQGGAKLPFYFNTGVADGERLRIKFVVEANATTPRAEVEGDVLATAADAGRAAVSFAGNARFSGMAELGGRSWSWQIAGPLLARARGAAMETFELRAGHDDRSFTATGKGEYRFGGIAEVSIETPRIDVDHLAGEGKGAAPDPKAAMQLAGEAIGRLASGSLTLPPARISIATPAVTIGAQTLPDLSLTLAPQARGHMTARLSVGLPGRAGLALEGLIETGAAAKFSGKVKAHAGDLALLSQWIESASPSLATQVKSLPFAQLSVEGDGDISAAGLFGRDLQIVADRSQFRGLVSVLRAVGAERARLVLDLVSPALDLDQLPDLSGLAGTIANNDLSFALDAQAVRLARFGQGMIDAGRIIVRAGRTSNAWTIERFDIADLGGANVAARGGFRDGSGQIDIDVDAEKLIELAAALQKVAPGVWSQALAGRAVALSPAKLRFSARAQRRGGNLHIANLTFSGTARGTAIEGSVAPGPNKATQLRARLSLANASTPLLLRQFGVETIALAGLPPARVEFEANGSPQKGFETIAKSALAGVQFDFRGQVGALLPAPALGGKLSLSSADISPLMQILALALPDAHARAPLGVTGDLLWRDQRISLSGLKGQAFGFPLTGELAWGAKENGTKRIEGALAFGVLSLKGLASIVLGPEQPTKEGAYWPELKFAPAIAEPPTTDIVVRAERFDLSPALVGRDARLRLQLGSGFVGLADLSMKLAHERLGGKSGGTLGGRVAIRRDGANASVAGRLAYDGPLAFAGDFSGNAQGELEFAGAGSSMAAIVNGLAGRGRISFKHLLARQADPLALERVIAAMQDRLDIKPAAVDALLARELARADGAFDGASFDIALAGGVASLAQNAASPRWPLAISCDLRRFEVDARMALSANAPEGWKGAAPQAGLLWQGGLFAPGRTRDIAALSNGLSARAIEREAERIALVEYDARERAALNRQARAREFLAMRAKEIVDWRAEQMRLEAEARRKAEEAQAKAEAEERQAEEAKRKAEEAKRKAEEAKRKTEDDVRRKQADAQKAALAREKREKERAGAIAGGAHTVPRKPAAATGGPLQLAPPVAPTPGAPARFTDPAGMGRY